MADKETRSTLSRRSFLKVAAAAGAAAVASSAGLAPALAKTALDPPTISCGDSTQTTIGIVVCAGASGAPAGFSVQWMTAADYTANGNTWYSSDDSRLCKASFSGNANLSRYDLRAGECVTVDVGEFLFDNGASTNCDGALVCGTEYVFRAFAHNPPDDNTVQKSDFTPNLTCSTAPCETHGDGCTLTQGYWGNKPNVEWPSPYSRDATFYLSGQTWQQVLDTPVNISQGYYQLAHQYIAAVLNKANGASVPSGVQDVLDLASAWLETNTPGVCTGKGACGTQKTWASTLDQFNNGLYPGGPGHCSDE